MTIPVGIHRGKKKNKKQEMSVVTFSVVSTNLTMSTHNERDNITVVQRVTVIEKGIVHLKTKILSFTHTHAIKDVYNFFVEHK